MTKEEKDAIVEAARLVLATDGNDEAEVVPILVERTMAVRILDLAYWGFGAVKKQGGTSSMFSEHEKALNEFGKLVNP